MQLNVLAVFFVRSLRLTHFCFVLFLAHSDVGDHNIPRALHNDVHKTSHCVKCYILGPLGTRSAFSHGRGPSLINVAVLTSNISVQQNKPHFSAVMC